MTTSPSPNTWTIPTVLSSNNLGPITTPFSLPPDCLQNLYDFQTPGLIPGALYTYYIQGCAISPCCPSSTPRAFASKTTAYLMDNIQSQNSLGTESVTLTGVGICLSAAERLRIRRFLQQGLSLQRLLIQRRLALEVRPRVVRVVRVVLSIPLGVWRRVHTPVPTTRSEGGRSDGLSAGEQIAISKPSALIRDCWSCTVLVAWLTVRWKNKEKDRTRRSRDEGR